MHRGGDRAARIGAHPARSVAHEIAQFEKAAARARRLAAYHVQPVLLIILNIRERH